MLVKILSFGTNWWFRMGSDSNHAGWTARHWVYYNSTGVRCGRKVRRHWIVPGLIRFNGIRLFDPFIPDRFLGNTFLCSDLDFLFGGNRLLFLRKMSRNEVPELYLVVLSADLHGRIDFASCDWRSPRTALIAASQLRDMQELMILMRAGDWVKTAFGFWQLNAPRCVESAPALALRAEPATF